VVTRHGAPVCWASSGLGDSVVADRLPLFASMVEGTPTAAAQDAYHRHAWAGRGAASVWMSRADARTVSVTVVESFPGGGAGETTGGRAAVRMEHLPVHAGATPESPMVPGEASFATLGARNLASRGG
jgi:hypothetical protein